MHNISAYNHIPVRTLAADRSEGSKHNSLANNTETAFKTSSGRFKWMGSRQAAAAERERKHVYGIAIK